MPTSDLSTISAVLYKVVEVNPKTILDAGVGWGKYGVLLREYLDFNKGFINRKSWKTRIDGIEVFEKYRTANWERYNRVSISDVRKLKFGNYDVILLCDILEHMNKKEAFKLLDRCIRNAKRVIVTTPLGLMKQEAVFGNKHEKHVCGFVPQDFKKYVSEVVIFKYVFMVSINGRK